MTKQPLLQVSEGCSGFYIFHNPSDRCKGMGDGVDEEFYLKRLDIFVCVGEEGFVEAWQHHIDEWEFCTYMEAYFHDLWALEVYRCGCSPWLYVVLEQDEEMVTGFFVRPDKPPMADQSPSTKELESGYYQLTSYLDLSWEEQGAIADALDEYEEA